MFFFNTLNQSEALTPLLLLLIALIINIFLGQNSLSGRLKGYSPNTLNKIIEWFDLKLNRENRSPLDRAVRGGITTIFVLLLSGIFGLVIIWLSANITFAWLFELFLILMVLDQSNTHKKVIEINKALSNRDIKNARQKLMNLTPEVSEKSDSYSIARTSIEFIAISLVTRVLAPVFYYALFGFIGLAIYHAITVLTIKIGNKTERYQDFGFTVNRLKFIILFIPSLLSGPLIVLACLFVPTANPIKSLKSILKYRNKIHNYNLGIALSAYAGAFDLALCQPKNCIGVTKKETWIGTGTAKATHKDIQRCLYLFSTVGLINGLLIITLIIMDHL
ncbi:MAG: cobalamin biosynthesis protein [Pseudomonadota bacterium]|nr:cobalamin biosynthesis protein [Pseudomonadota bacterium]